MTKIAGQQNKEAGTLNGVPVFNVIKCTLTFEGFDPWEFKFQRQLSTEAKKAKEVFYGLKEEEQKEIVIAHRVEQLAMLLLERPENIPDFPDSGDFRKDFTKYFMEFTDAMAWLWQQYQNKLYPKEIFSSVSE